MRFVLLVTSFQCSLIVYLCRVLVIEFRLFRYGVHTVLLKHTGIPCLLLFSINCLLMQMLYNISIFPTFVEETPYLMIFFFCRAMLNPFAYFLRIILVLFLLRSPYMLIISIHDYNETNRTTSRF